MDDSFESTSTEERLESPSYPPATKMDFGLAEMKSEKKNQSLILISFAGCLRSKFPTSFARFCNLETKPF